MATVRFLSDWSNPSNSEIRPGEPLRLEYDLARSCQCRAERYGQKAWSLVAHLRFHPGNQERAGDISSGALEVDVPPGTDRIELWFHNSDHTGCSAWDSRYGENYWLDVKPPS
ncbi:DUF6209 family protein [Nannocystis sp. ILAH1]|uniref:DUF6209 family protein n=1 Tax=unclassified Nannocystis TaxID=2627009 RepID=UPI00226F3473|nr:MULTISPECIES: DUF6209 family protein [unclassified Nannocystis]MCY0994905.1 DUF6209 family protein [Nannocystis sp. ILAH1]MCY1065266.1 DUF6209 family protein [Nannocystis sp. RBIL2]